MTELILDVGPPANGGSCIARHDGRVVFVRYALPGERVRARVTAQRDSYWQAECVEVLTASADRVDSLCPIAGVDGAGCCDLAFADPAAARALKGEVVANQLARLGDFAWEGAAEPLPDGGATGWRSRIRLDVGADGRAGFHRYHSDALVTDLSCGQLPTGMTKGLPEEFRAGDHVHVVLDDDGVRHVVSTGREHRPYIVEGDYHATQWVNRRRWQIPVTAFWQAHRGAAAFYSDLVTEWAAVESGGTAWDLYGGAGVFAAALAAAVGESGRVLTADTSRAASGAARVALADLPQVKVVTDSVRRVLAAQSGAADVAVLDPPRTGAGRDVIEALGSAEVPRVVHIGCEAASFARDIGLYRRQGYTVEAIRVFDAFPLTHHVECVALLTR
ncbi:class I SAM-dependent RNA methyltransferase [Mycobacterium sp. M1]|uniref:Class I SAM-dependent RNA methyltransferase n=1 Tax=Mycolicibacter acidiphilus TaxID=2835306 RepID=A0ABS5RCM4_9MYCO|nr:TRAM domain-containing protein [Mycolicibacter acidiphilus]MBS9532037.1 class I SAM-dependent RNA methyltransferase [Mycolicibacter acidiphilus]